MRQLLPSCYIRRGGRSVLLHGAIVGLCALTAITSVAARAAEPDAGPATRPVLEQLSREIQTLYHDSQNGLVRVQLPAPRWLNDYALAPINKWQNINPDVRQKLEQAQQQAYSQSRTYSNSSQNNPANGDAGSGTTRPANEPAGNQGTIIIVRPSVDNSQQQAQQQRDNVIGGRLQMDARPGTEFAPNNLGLLLDDRGYVLIPIYIERETCAEQPVRCGQPGGDVVTAKFIGSDRQTNLSVVQIDHAAGAAMRFGANRPEVGSIVLYLSPADGSGRLGIWTGGAQDYGVAVTTDGQVAGIARYGQFLSGHACRLIGEQIIRFGAVKRATLGVIIREVRLDDALRRQVPALGARTAMHIDEVVPGSAADRAGLKPNDVLLALAGEAVSDVPSLAAAIASRSGQTELQVLRGEQILSITVDLQQK